MTKLYMSTFSNSNSISIDTIFEEVVKRAIPYNSYRTDLYLEVTPETTKLINKYEFAKNVKIFKDNLNGKKTFDIPFVYGEKEETRLLKKYGQINSKQALDKKADEAIALRATYTFKKDKSKYTVLRDEGSDSYSLNQNGKPISKSLPKNQILIVLAQILGDELKKGDKLKDDVPSKLRDLISPISYQLDPKGFPVFGKYKVAEGYKIFATSFGTIVNLLNELYANLKQTSKQNLDSFKLDTSKQTSTQDKYIENQLKGLGKETDEPLSIVITNRGKKTKSLTLNQENLPTIIKFLQENLAYQTPQLKSKQTSKQAEEEGKIGGVVARYDLSDNSSYIVTQKGKDYYIKIGRVLTGVSSSYVDILVILAQKLSQKLERDKKLYIQKATTYGKAKPIVILQYQLKLKDYPTFSSIKSSQLVTKPIQISFKSIGSALNQLYRRTGGLTLSWVENVNPRVKPT